MSADDDMSFLLSLVAREREARNSAAWKIDVEAACEAHGDAVDTLFNELYRMLDGKPVEAAKPTRPEVIKRQLRAEMKAELRRSLPSVVAQLVDDL